MKPSRPLRVLFLALACSAALAAQAQGGRIDIPAGDLAGALDAYARQSGTQLVYRADQLKGARTAGLQGQAASPQALDALLKGSGFHAQRDDSGAVLVLAQASPAKPAPAAAPARPRPSPPPPQAATNAPVTDLETIQVTGSRIPRAQVEGPAPITIVTAEAIKAAGLTSVPDVLKSLSQNNGYTYGQQNTTNAQSTPGAQAVDLRGLGPNHTLVLVNGRRIADFPLPLNSRPASSIWMRSVRWLPRPESCSGFCSASPLPGLPGTELGVEFWAKTGVVAKASRSKRCGARMAEL